MIAPGCMRRAPYTSPGESSRYRAVPTTPAYSATSDTVRRYPFVNGTLSGHGGKRTVPGRSQYNTPPINGEKRPVSCIEPDPSPRISHSSVHAASFWNTIGAIHQCPMSPSPPRSGVVAHVIRKPPATKRISFTM